jgi:hypothetical protein
MEHAMRASRSLPRISAKLKIREAHRVTEAGKAKGKMVVVTPD